MMKKIILILCLLVSAGLVLAQGPGGFTANLDAGYSNTGSYTTQHNINYDASPTHYCHKDGNTLPDWYVIDSGLFVIINTNCIKTSPNVGDNQDFDRDGCTNYEEYENFLENPTKSQFVSVPNDDCFCNNNSICEFNFGEDYFSCPHDCSNYCNEGGTSECEPHLGEYYAENTDIPASLGRCDQCNTYTFSLKSDIDSIPEFNGAALIILVVLAAGLYYYQGHHKK